MKPSPLIHLPAVIRPVTNGALVLPLISDLLLFQMPILLYTARQTEAAYHLSAQSSILQSHLGRTLQCYLEIYKYLESLDGPAENEKGNEPRTYDGESPFMRWYKMAMKR